MLPLWRIQLFVKAPAGSDFQVQSWLERRDLASYLLPDVTFGGLLEIRPIKGQRHGPVAQLPEGISWTSWSACLYYPLGKQLAGSCQSATLSRAAPELGNGKYRRSEALLPTCSLRLNIISACLHLDAGKSPTLFTDKTEPRDKAMIPIEQSSN